VEGLMCGVQVVGVRRSEKVDGKIAERSN